MGVVSLMTLAFMGLMAWGILNNDPVTGRSGFTRVGKPAPDFTLSLFGGGELTLSQHKGQPVVINFWASSCAPCRQEAPALERSWLAYKDRGVLMVGVNTLAPPFFDNESDSLAFLSEFNITYPNGSDIGGKITVDYGVIGIPVTFFVNDEGVVERRWVGRIDERQLLDWTGELVSGVAPSGETEGENLEDFFELNS